MWILVDPSCAINLAHTDRVQIVEDGLHAVYADGEHEMHCLAEFDTPRAAQDFLRWLLAQIASGAHVIDVLDFVPAAEEYKP